MDVITPGGTDYEALQHAWARPGAPALILQPRNADEVESALARAISHGGPISVRSGGHGIGVVSTNDGGTVIDLHHLASIERVDDGTVRVGPGARWGAVAQTLAPWGLAISAGDVADVGVGGLAVAGGIGLMARSHGLTIDNIRSVDVVTPEGFRHTSDTSEPDLFWAMRGAGGFFGIATSFDIAAAPITDVIAANLTFVGDDLASLIAGWADLVEQAHRTLSAFLYLLPGPKPTAKTTIVWADDDEAAGRAAIRPFLNLPGIVQQHVRRTAYSSVLLPDDGPHLGKARIRARNGLANVIDLEIAQPIAEFITAGTGIVQIRAAGGAINDVPAAATAYAHRHQQFSIAAIAPNPAAPLDDAWAPIGARTDGVYSAFETPGAARWLQRTYPDRTLTRLRRMQQQWDPERVLSELLDGAPIPTR
jgi:FAD/FMN-containing dehydrogenase